jgi:hypothetical protein
MKHLITFFSFLLLISSCNKQSEKPIVENQIVKKDSPIVKNETQGSSAKNKDDIKNDKFEKLIFDKNNVPQDCSFKGEIVDGAHWKDLSGENILLITQTRISRKNQDVRNQYLYGYLYTLSNDKWNLTWNITDFVESYCDAEAKYIDGTLEVLDIDNDGIAENAFIYKLDERCDVSPLPIKLMMHSGSKKLVIRGDTKVDIGNGQIIGGKKSFDDAFNSSPESFKEYASKKWDKFMRENKNP